MLRQKTNRVQLATSQRKRLTRPSSFVLLSLPAVLTWLRWWGYFGCRKWCRWQWFHCFLLSFYRWWVSRRPKTSAGITSRFDWRFFCPFSIQCTLKQPFSSLRIPFYPCRILWCSLWEALLWRWLSRRVICTNAWHYEYWCVSDPNRDGSYSGHCFAVSFECFVKPQPHQLLYRRH